VADTRAEGETLLRGVPLSGGIALARACLFDEQRHNQLSVYRIEGQAAEAEVARLTRAMDVVADRLDGLREQVAREVGAAEAEIFVAQRMIVTDSSLREDVYEAIRSRGLNAEPMVAQVLDSYEDRISRVDDEYIKERATDIGEVKRRILDVLRNLTPSLECQGEEHCQRGRERVVVARELTPTLTIDLETEHTRGFVTERGGPGSHAAILARALGIPAVSGIRGVHDRILCGTELLIDGDTGEVVVWPSPERIAALAPLDGSLPVPRPVGPIDGLEVMASISSCFDVVQASRMMAEGIGLYRTEFESLAERRILSEGEQSDRYASVVKAMRGAPVTIRLLDLGGDKAAPFLGLEKEENPHLGLRGARLLTARPELLGVQARAIARASLHGPVHVMYPMIVDLEQFLELREAFRGAVVGIEYGEIRHGVMFEVPSACLQAREILEHAEFGSIGSNDLVQFLFAIDRDNERVASDYSGDRPAFWLLVDIMVRAAKETGRPLSVCGEMASEPRTLVKLLEHGITSVSVSSRLIPGVRMEARKHLS
jgi:phosphotransferase system enzyme I (PtsI)